MSSLSYIERLGPSLSYPSLFYNIGSVSPIFGLIWVSLSYIGRLSSSLSYPSLAYLGRTKETMLSPSPSAASTSPITTTRANGECEFGMEENGIQPLNIGETRKL